jgi:hypothetical protein
MRLNNVEKYYLGFLIVLCLFMSIVVCKLAHAEDIDEPILEKVESIDGTKSMLYYCNDTGSYVIYSKKSGGWYELSDGEGWTLLQEEPTEEEPTEEPTEEEPTEENPIFVNPIVDGTKGVR